MMPLGTAKNDSRRVLSVYEKWLWTDSRSAYKELIESGINPIRVESMMQ